METKFTKGLKVVGERGANLEIMAVISPDKVPNPSELFTLPGKRELRFSIGEDDKLMVHLAYDRWVQFPKTNPFGVDWDEMQLANATLWAAAPEMYEALELARNYTHDAIATVIDEALAKARGES